MDDKKTQVFMTDAQLDAERQRCEYCENRPCQTACPADCSPVDFIMATRLGAPSDYERAAAKILSKNPLGGVCGLVCTEKHCMSGCSHLQLDGSIRIPDIQAAIIQRAKDLGKQPRFEGAAPNGKKVAILGGGPAGLAAAAILGIRGYAVTIHDEMKELGGACWQIPESRLPREVLRSDIAFIQTLGQITVKTGQALEEPQKLLDQGFDAVVVATGLGEPVTLGLEGEDLALSSAAFLNAPEKYRFEGTVAVVGGGATAADAAVTAKRRGARHVEMFALEVLGEMPLYLKEREHLQEEKVDVQGRVRVSKILRENGKIQGIELTKVALTPGKDFSLAEISDLPGTEYLRKGIDHLILAIGARPGLKPFTHDRVFFAGDGAHGPSSVVEAVAGGKHAAEAVHAALSGAKAPVVEDSRRSDVTLPGLRPRPVSLESEFFGRKIETPFILSAAPPSDGYEQMKKAYEAGWSGGVLKTSFAGGPIHIPAEYMFQFDDETYANCDNVSGHLLDRTCAEVERLVKEFPEKLTILSTGGPVTGDDASDKAAWQANTKRIEASGAHGIEYSLSCPQGGDGTEGDIVSQNAALTARIIDWVLECSDPDVPKLFKLTPAVTSIKAIVLAIKEVLEKHPTKKAGITLANTFPSMAFRPNPEGKWDAGVVVGMSGEMVTPISYLSLANVAGMGVVVSGNGGPMNYKAAADFLALGAETVQFCTIVMKHGYGIIDELCAGVSHLMQERGMKSMKELIGSALPHPIVDFMDLSPVKKISDADKELCLKCGNCTRCPYLAISPDEDGYPMTDPEHCIGCSICAQKCFAKAITMRDRTPEEAAALKED